MKRINLKQKSRRGLITITLLTILSISMVMIVYAVLVGSFQGDEVTVGGMGSAALSYTINDSDDTGPWTTTLAPSTTSTAWYSRLEITGGDYSGPVTITWQLQEKTGPSTWTDISGATETTTITLSGSAENVYTTSDGAWATGNYDWSSDITAAGAYRVIVTVDSA